MNEQQAKEFLTKFMAEGKSKNSLIERNRRVLKRNLTENDDVRAMRTEMRAKYGIDPITDTEKFPVLKESFSWKKFRGQLNEQLKEADSSTAFTQFLRAGIQNITAGMYESTPVTYEDWVTVVPSGRAEEPYAPMHGVSFPRQVGPQVPYPEVAAAALDLKLKNYKYGSVYAVEKELLEDDQTGQFQRQAGMMGEYLRVLAEVLCYGKLASVSGMSYSGFDVPTSETKPSTEAAYPWSTGLVGGGKTKPASYGALTQSNIQAGFIALMAQKNLQGIIMNVAPNRIMISPYYSFDLSVLLNSAYYPSGAAAAGAVGGAFAINPLKGIADATVARYMFDNAGAITGNSKAWYLVDDSKPFFVLQQRTPIAVEQENPQAGESFQRDIYRFKAYSRQNADFIDPRFAWQGSDGSV